MFTRQLISGSSSLEQGAGRMRLLSRMLDEKQEVRILFNESRKLFVSQYIYFTDYDWFVDVDSYENFQDAVKYYLDIVLFGEMP